MSIENLRKEYENIEIPKEIDVKIYKSIIKGVDFMNKKKSRRKLYTGTVAGIVAGICVCFITSINMVPSFAETMSNTPVIGEVAQYLTFNKVEDEKVVTTIFEENTELKISYPKIDGMKDTVIQDKINANIKKEILSVAKRLAAEANVVKSNIEAAIGDTIIVTYSYVTSVNNNEYDQSFTLALDKNTGEVLTRTMK
jgi:hypothetical protein